MAQRPVSTDILLEEAEKRWYTIEPINSDCSMFFLQHWTKRILFNGTDWWGNSKLGKELCDKKHLTYAVLQHLNIHYPKYTILTRQEALSEDKIRWLTYPLVVKPFDGMKGNGVIVDIQDYEMLTKALEYSFTFSNKIIIQNQVFWKNLRILVVDNKIAAWLEWQKHLVIGNGKDTILSLLQQENANPHRGNDPLLSPLASITIDKKLEEFFKAQYGYALTHIPYAWESLMLKWNWYDSTADITDKIPPPLQNICIKISQTLQLKFTGIDIIYAPSLAGENYRVLEVNAQPGIKSHHTPVTGEWRDIAWLLLDFYFN